MMEEQPFVSVIVPVYNDAGSLLACLEALEHQSYSRSGYEVVVVDNGSDDDVAGVVDRFAQARLIREPRTGSYAARNAGMLVARGELFAFTDSDCVPAPDWIEQGVAAWQQYPAAGLLGGRVDVFLRDPTRPTSVELHQGVCAFDQSRNIRSERFAVTANAFISRSVIERIGPFDERLRSGGDKEFGRRVHAHGLEQRYADGARVRHPAPHSLRELATKYRRVTGGLFQLADGNLRRQLRLAAVVLAAPAVKLRAYWSHPDLSSARSRFVFLGVELAVAAVRLAELGRLKLGGTPRRR
jgi:glycosyltransferase involved in cell wall biosynthesis